MSEETGFQVTDRRRVRNPEAADASAVPPEPDPESEATGTPSEGAEAAAEPGAPQITTQGFLWYAVYWLEERAWVSMGLRPDPATGKVTRNLDDARLAIDAISDLLKHVEAGAPPEMKRDLHVMLSNLQVNYVRQVEQG